MPNWSIDDVKLAFAARGVTGIPDQVAHDAAQALSAGGKGVSVTIDEVTIRPNDKPY